MKKYVLGLLFAFICLIPSSIQALESEDDGFKTLAMEEKYYKTVTFTNNFNYYSIAPDDYISYTEEITKEEYESAPVSQIMPQGTINAYIETTYKKLNSYILTNGAYYRYQATLNWKLMPKVRSYDTIAIGHNASVKIRGNVQFAQTYCEQGGDCRTLNVYYPQTFATGSAATFKVPTGDFSSLNQTIYFDVQKNVDATIISQKASADYAHAVKTVTVAQAKNFNLTVAGISFHNSVKDYFDEIATATSSWEGSW